ncbi:hypothetical protein [Lysobacter arvi]|uniref:Uncharacterized protein n=1 Tax=Lysobacter arvi TaxID=3038776 RepID=A0ABU1CF68_9GAMM|nr:hypothetical protein [Lysobacter arvi]MDR0183572.1 hypothetical protein [Lysobacter arvi]
MILFQFFAACSVAGGLPGFAMIIRNMLKGYRGIRRLEVMARSEGQYLGFTNDLEAKRKLLFKPNNLITDADSERLADVTQDRDQLGDVVVAASGTGTRKGDLYYGPFGEPNVTTGMRFRYTGR